MIYVKNLPTWERALRIGIGAALGFWAILSDAGSVSWVLAACGIGAALTGIFGFCPACALAGRKLEKQARKG